MIQNAVFVAIGAFFGAMARFWVSNFAKNRFNSSFPYGTIIVNLIGSFLLGYVLMEFSGHVWPLLLGTGFMGSFTTFSTFKLESIELQLKQKWNSLILYLAISYTFGILLAFLGMKVASL